LGYSGSLQRWTSLGAAVAAAVALAGPPAAAQPAPPPSDAAQPGPPPGSAQPGPPPQAGAPPPGIVNTNVNLRQGPGTNYTVITTLPAGSRVVVSGCSGQWCQVSAQGQNGYVIASSLGPGGPPPGGPPPGYYPPPPGYYPPPPYYGPSPYYSGYGPYYGWHGGYGWHRHW